jgi:hypothetical protein
MFVRMIVLAGAIGVVLPATTEAASQGDVIRAYAFARPDLATIHALDTEEMDRLRGAAGVIFGGNFTSIVEGAAIGDLPAGWNVSSLGDNQVAIQTGFGSFQDFTGVLQLANVVGNFNVVHNIMNLNVTINNEGGTLSLR